MQSLLEAEKMAEKSEVRIRLHSMEPEDVNTKASKLVLKVSY
jgi:hypothetical protein